MSNAWKMIQEKKEMAKHMQKRHKYILVPSQRYQDSRHLLQNPTVPNNVVSFNNRAQRFTGSNYLDVESPFGRSFWWRVCYQRGIPCLVYKQQWF